MTSTTNTQPAEYAPAQIFRPPTKGEKKEYRLSVFRVADGNHKRFIAKLSGRVPAGWKEYSEEGTSQAAAVKRVMRRLIDAK